jgi:tripartite ATP-independent transporter DctM subunit
MAVLYTTYIVVRCWLQPHLAPPYLSPPTPLWPKILNTVIYVFPMVTIIFLVIGLMFLGVATPTESAAMGTIGAFVLAWLYGGLTWSVAKESLRSTLGITVMMFMILTGSTAFSQILAFTGASTGLVETATAFDVAPIYIVMIMMAILIVMGTFMEPLSIMLLTVPIYLPIIEAFQFSEIWFGAIMLLNMQMASTSPPFGLGLFVMKGVAPDGTTMTDIYKAALPFLACDSVALVLMIVYPPLVLWLPGLMAT